MTMFLESDELTRLTGRSFKSRKIEWLRKEGIPFRVNATGHPVVLRSAVDNRAPVSLVTKSWTPRVVGT